MNSEKDLPGLEVCYDPALVSSKEEHIRTVCGSFIPTTSDVELPSIKDLLSNCLNTDKFCNSCCSHFIGTQWVMKR